MIYIVASTEEELYSLRDELGAQEASGGVGFPVERHILGIGPARAGKSMDAILAKGKRKPQAVLMLGIAGAVEPRMETGELTLAAKYVMDSGDSPRQVFSPDPAMLELAEAAAADARMPVDHSHSLTVDHMVSETQEREQLRQKYGVGSVNMEDYAVAISADAAGVPFLSVRVILDTAEQKLPDYLQSLSGDRNAIFTEVVFKPWRIPTLRRLKKQMDLCQAVLARFAMSYLKLEAERRKSEREKVASQALY